MTGLVYVWLEVKHRRAMWVVGFVMSACYVAVFGLKGLYASMGLYVYYLGMSVYGWLKWGEQVTGGGGVAAGADWGAAGGGGRGIAGGEFCGDVGGVAVVYGPSGTGHGCGYNGAKHNSYVAFGS